MLGSCTRTMLFLLVCIGLLSDNRYKVSAMRSREFFLTQTQEAEPDAIAKLKSISLHFKDNIEDQEMLGENRRILEEVNKNEVKADQKTQEEEQKNKTNDSFKSSKRRVRRGSDPIHNKAQPFS